MTGRVLSDEELRELEIQFEDHEAFTVERDLISTIRFHEGIKKVLWEQNTIMRETLERINGYTDDSYVCVLCSEALAKVRGGE